MTGVNDANELSLRYNGDREGTLDWGAATSERLELQRERWYKYTSEVKLNTPGQSDGFVKLYLDDELIASRDNLEIRSSSEHQINTILFGGWYSNGIAGNPSPDPVTPSSFLIDDIRVSTGTSNEVPSFEIDLDSTADGSGLETRFTEGGSPARVASENATIQSDLSELDRAIFEITNDLDGSDELLTADVSGTNISVQDYDPTTRRLTLSGNDSVENYLLALSRVEYANNSQNPSTTDRQIEVSFASNGRLSNTAITEVSVLGTNDAPELTVPELFRSQVDLTLGSTIEFVATAVDPDDTSTTFSLDLTDSGIGDADSQPSLTSQPTQTQLTWTPDQTGIFEIILVATDASGASDRGTVLISVSDLVSSKFFESNFTEDYPVNGCVEGSDTSLCNGDEFSTFDDPANTMEVGMFSDIDPNSRILRTTYAENEDGRRYRNDGSLPDEKKLYGAFEFYLDGNFWDASSNSAGFAQAYKMPRIKTNGVTTGPGPNGPRQFDLILQNASGDNNIDIQFQNVFGSVTDPANNNSPSITVPAQNLVEQWYRVTFGIELNTAAENGFMSLTLEPINADGSSAGTRLTEEFTGNVSDPADTFNLTDGLVHFMSNWSTGVGQPPNPEGQSIYWRNIELDDETIAP